MLKAIAIDDEPLALEVIKKLAVDITFLDLTATFTNSFHAMDFLQNNKVDLIFLDIKMPNISGIDFLKSLTNAPMVIVTTAYGEYAVQSFDLNVLDYLLKPFSLARFLKACNKALDLYKLKNNSSLIPADSNHIFLKSGYEQIRVNLDDIIYIESVGNYLHVNLKDDKVISRLTMGEIEAILPSSSFMRIHRSFIVPKKAITKIDKKSLWIGTKEFTIGVLYLDEIRQVVNKY
ncbi:LytTR family DNA-binding domain-containing protein [Pedobacter sp. FW305-3-2-15-E-R2A2]|uniref:LytR/AlgR family response regulator transcription factor n=1 Tax=Pedobacter sp. FW305-3-2-15-E-R2A2 TaxID=3140251 RepID=UPI00313FEE95